MQNCNFFFFLQSCSSLEDEISYDNFYDWSLNRECPLHDLSTWRVTIPRIGGRPDPDNNRKLFFVFIIDVHRVDVSSDGKYTLINLFVLGSFITFNENSTD